MAAPDFDGHLLRAFTAVCDAGTISRAAQQLARTQAAVSMQLQRLEESVGTALLIRSPRGVTPTEAGEILLAYARRSLALGEDARRQIAGRRLVGRVRLGLIEDLAFTRLPALLADFRQRYPEVEIEMTADGSSALAQAIRDARCDLAVADPARFASAPRRHWRRQLTWCASRMVDIPDNGPWPLILFDTACAWQDRMLASLAQSATPWRPGCRVSTFAALIAALRAGLGLAPLLPESIPPDCRAVEAKGRLPSAPSADFGLFLAPDATALVTELADYLGAGMAG